MLPSLFFFCGASDGAVTLESPALPVAQGDNVTLRCRTQATFSPDVPANFYKDGLLVAGSPARSVTVHAVSAADQGLYRCDVSGAGGSAASRLTVRAGRPDPPTPTLAHPEVGVGLSLLVVLVVLAVLAVLVFFLWRNCKGEELSYSDVTVTQGAPPPAAPKVCLWTCRRRCVDVASCSSSSR
ncbi:uncharacterized protein LOC144410290 [Gasterosteus aculeatus]